MKHIIGFILFCGIAIVPYILQISVDKPASICYTEKVEEKQMRTYKTMVDFGDDHVTEAIINGKTVKYDAMTDGDLEAAKKFYYAFNYIGSGRVTFVNGVYQGRDNKKSHFFVRKQLKYGDVSVGVVR